MKQNMQRDEENLYFKGLIEIVKLRHTSQTKKSLRHVIKNGLHYAPLVYHTSTTPLL